MSDALNVALSTSGTRLLRESCLNGYVTIFDDGKALTAADVLAQVIVDKEDDKIVGILVQPVEYGQQPNRERWVEAYFDSDGKQVIEVELVLENNRVIDLTLSLQIDETEGLESILALVELRDADEEDKENVTLDGNDQPFTIWGADPHEDDGADEFVSGTQACETYWQPEIQIDGYLTLREGDSILTDKGVVAAELGLDDDGAPVALRAQVFEEGDESEPQRWVEATILSNETARVTATLPLRDGRPVTLEIDFTPLVEAGVDAFVVHTRSLTEGVTVDADDQPHSMWGLDERDDADDDALPEADAEVVHITDEADAVDA